MTLPSRIHHRAGEVVEEGTGKPSGETPSWDSLNSLTLILSLRRGVHRSRYAENV